MNQKLAQFIIGDEVRRRLIQIMCPNVRPLSVWSEELWDQLEIHCNVQPALNAAVNGYVVPALDPSRPVLVDAYVTSHRGFRSAFPESLKRSGFDVSGEQLFWIDTPQKRVVAQSNSRITNGERPGEKPIDLPEVHRRRDRIVRRVKLSECIVGVDTQSVVNEIERFFG